MSRALNLVKSNASNPRVWVVIGLTVAGVVVVAETRRRRRKLEMIGLVDFGAFVQRFELLPFPQPLPPAAKQALAGMTFAIKDMSAF